MNPQFQQASFIPKRPLARSGQSRRRFSKHGTGALHVIGLTLFFIAVAGTIGVFAYDRYLKNHITNLEQELEVATQIPDIAFVEEVKLFDIRLRTANELVTNHIAVSEVLRLLQEVTLHRVQFTNMKFDATKKDADAVVSLEGVASTFATLSLQADEMKMHKDINEATFSNVKLTEDGNVSFSVKLAIDPEVIRYRRLFEEEAETTQPTDTDTSASADNVNPL